MNNRTSKSIDILLVEDNAGDVRLMREALKHAKITDTMHVVSDGVKAISFLRKEGEYAEMPTPDLIILDLNMPKKDGREVLAEIKENDILKRIPVVILTTSEDEQDIRQSYEVRANCYIQKPVDLDQFMKVVQSIEEFWLTIVKLPIQ